MKKAMEIASTQKKEYGKVGVVECLGEFRCPGLDFTGPYGKKSE